MRFKLLRFGWLGLILLHLVPGFSGAFILEIVIAGLLIAVVSGAMNDMGMIPGTKPYEIKHQLRRAEMQLQIDRVQLVRTRLRTRESQEIERTLMLERGPDRV